VSLLFQSQPSPTPGVCPVACPAGGGTFLMPEARESGSLCPDRRTPRRRISDPVASKRGRRPGADGSESAGGRVRIRSADRGEIGLDDRESCYEVAREAFKSTAT